MNPDRLGSVAPHVYPGRVPFIGWRATILSLLLGAVFVACGGGWSDSDTKNAFDAVHAESMAMALCAADAGTCTASQVRALERAAICSNASMLFSHGQTFDAGVSCQPR